MNGPAATMAALGTGLLAAVVTASPTTMAPAWSPAALVVVGGFAVAWGLLRSGPRVHAAGALLQFAGVGVVGPLASPLLVLSGALGVVLAVGAWTVGHTVTHGSGAWALVAAGVVAAAATALVGWLATEGLARAAGGGIDARVGVPAWMVLAVASTWLLARRSGGGG